MNQAWRTLALAGGFGIAALSATAVADDPKEEPPVQAPKPDEVVAPKAALVVPPPTAVATGPMWVGDYVVGHVHEPGLSHLFWYSAYNPFLDELHAPMRTAVYGGRHARYYAGYRTVYNSVNWNTYYLPTAQCYAPGGYGYQAGGYAAPPGALANAYDWSPYRPGPYATPYAGYGRARTANYGAGYGPAVANPTTAVPPSGVNVNGFRYTGDPAVYSPYGVGSSSYFGAYGSAGY
ncbi:MAG: hypothetical protein M3552_09960 [Planctomycetota bacterium]|nr:hypothetical protein [Planctomycetaceae bacterium]MDQ3330963.1 hypothetical protein [Planctomycetota bacterium]